MKIRINEDEVYEISLKEEISIQELNSILQRLNNLSKYVAKDVFADALKDLLKIFKNHIGEENFISPVELFTKIYGTDPSRFDIFRRNYMWNAIKGILRQLRNDEVLFVINKGTKLFVLKSVQEKEDFKKKMDRNIEQLKSLKVKADSWVNNKKWKKIM